MASVSSGLIIMGIVVVIGSLICFAYADDEIYPGGMVIPKFNSSEIGTMQNSEKFNSSEIGTMQNSEKFNSSEIGTMQNTVSTVPLPPGVTV